MSTRYIYEVRDRDDGLVYECNTNQEANTVAKSYQKEYEEYAPYTVIEKGIVMCVVMCIITTIHTQQRGVRR